MSKNKPDAEKPESVVVHGHDYEVDELEEKELDQAAGGLVDKSAPDLMAVKPVLSRARVFDKSGPDLP